MKIGLIGRGAIARYVMAALKPRGHRLGAILLRPNAIAPAKGLAVGSVSALPGDLDLMIDCAGHEALASYGPQILARGCDLISISLGALADAKVEARLTRAAKQGGAKLYLASGAIGGLDCLSAARAGNLYAVTYSGRKPPQGWKGSPAEQKLDLDTMSKGDDARVHFQGNARAAALAYPKNANVAAAVALAGLGFDDTQVQLIADPQARQNIHEVTAQGDFGQFHIRINGNSLPDNPRSSALAAMSVVSKLDQLTQSLVL